LPEPLRFTDVTLPTSEQPPAAEALPEFLADEEDKSDNEDEQPQIMAAE
jgi:hypothetical protein